MSGKETETAPTVSREANTEGASTKGVVPPMDHSKRTAPRVPDHERIRLDAAANPERSYNEHVEAAREIAGRTFVEDLSRIQRRGLEEEGLS